MIISIIISCLAGIVITSTAFITYNITNRRKKHSKEIIRQSNILRDQINSVFKITTLEIQFSQVHRYEDNKDIFFGIFQSTKSALLIVNAKGLIGFDFSKSLFEIDTVNKCVTFKEIPPPEVLGLDTDYEFYDVKDGIFNKFKIGDINQVLENSKNDLREKCLNDCTIQKANHQLIISLNYLTKIVDWNLQLPPQLSTNQIATSDSTDKMIE